MLNVGIVDVSVALNEEKLITETDMAFHEKLQQYIQKQIDLESCPSLFQHKVVNFLTF